MFKLSLKIFNNMPELGTLTFTIPSYLLEDETSTSATTVSQNYLNNFDYVATTGVTSGYTGMTYYAIGGSRIQEKKLYGGGYSGVTTGMTEDNVIYSAYSFTYSGQTMGSQTLYYADFPDGHTMITGHTTGFTEQAVFSSILTRNEHFLGFVEQPRIYSDIFVERGKMGVLENNHRLGEIGTLGDLEYYGNKYFNVKKL